MKSQHKFKRVYILMTPKLFIKLQNDFQRLNLTKEDNKISATICSATNYKYFRFMGQELLDLGVTTDNDIISWYSGKIIPGYIYDVYICKDEQTVNKLRFNAPAQANKMINKYCGITEPNLFENRAYEDETSDKNIEITTWELYEPFRPDIDYVGYWYEIDANSAYPWAVTQIVKSDPIYYHRFIGLSDYIKNELYPVKRDSTDKEIKTKAKLELLCLTGCLAQVENGYYKHGIDAADLYLTAKKYASDYLATVKKILEDAGAEVFDKRTDAFIFRAPKDFKIPETIKIGKELGEFKIECYSEYGTIRADSKTAKERTSTVKGIESKGSTIKTLEQELLQKIQKDAGDNTFFI